MGLLDWLSLGLDFCPVIGEAKAILELISGKDLVTQEDLDAFDRATCAISVLPAAGWMAKMSKTSKASKNAKKFEKFFNLVNKANKANDAVDKFNCVRLILDESGFETQKMKFEPKFKASPKVDLNAIAKVTITNPTYKYIKKDGTVVDLVDDVIQGNWGNGEERKKRLEAAGYNYKVIQEQVNKRLKKK